DVFVADASYSRTRPRLPLRKARVVVEDGEPMRFWLTIRPNFKSRGAFFTLRVTAILEGDFAGDHDGLQERPRDQSREASAPVVAQRENPNLEIAATFHSNGELLVIGDGRGRVHWLELATGRVRRRIETGAPVRELARMAGGALAASRSGGSY